jgi:hypothetical protein
MSGASGAQPPGTGLGLNADARLRHLNYRAGRRTSGRTYSGRPSSAPQRDRPIPGTEGLGVVRRPSRHSHTSKLCGCRKSTPGDRPARPRRSSTEGRGSGDRHRAAQGIKRRGARSPAPARGCGERTARSRRTHYEKVVDRGPGLRFGRGMRRRSIPVVNENPERCLCGWFVRYTGSDEALIRTKPGGGPHRLGAAVCASFSRGPRHRAPSRLVAGAPAPNRGAFAGSQV